MPPPVAALEREWVRTATPGHTVLATVRHAAHAWAVPWPQAAPEQAWLAAMGNRYLQAVQAVLDGAPDKTRLVPEAVLRELAQPWPSARGAIRWLPLGEDHDGTTLTPAGTPHCSHWVHLANGAPGEGSLVLLAGRAAGSRPLGGDIGARLVVHVQGQTGRIHGVVASGLWDPASTLPDKDAKGQSTTPENLLDAVQSSLRAYLATDDAVCIDGLTGADGPGHRGVALRAWGHTYTRPQDPHGRAPAQMRSRKLDFYAELNNVYKVLRMSQRSAVRTSCAAPKTTRVAAVPPAQQLRPRETRPRPPRLNGERSSIELPSRSVLAVTGPNNQRWLEVQGMNPLRRPPPQASPSAQGVDRALALATKELQPTKRQGRNAGSDTAHPARLPGDQDAAMHAYLRGQHLFDRLQAYGFSPEAYFRFARLPLVLRPRAGFSGAPEGDQPAAEVRPFFSEKFRLQEGQTAAPRPQLLVKFGSADAHDRELRAGSLHAPERPRAQYLGVAADARWAWHEFGHVLCYASTGELEFEFAHSVGDALAAVTCDPVSDLADDPQRRGETFPWIQVPGRRHDRQARLGHCWCGSRNLLRLQPGGGPRRLFQHGYFEEQLLSSALFRLYRCIGGDTDGSTEADRLVRLAASDYTVYLVMRALALLGPDNLASARTPNQWVSALVDADLGQASWSVAAGWAALDGQPRLLQRAGGQLVKVIRWAFEQQGLYATDDPEAVAEGLGKPPTVDLYLPDQRTPGSGAAGGDGDGGYWPVALRAGWSARPMPAPQPGWWAAPSAITRAGRQLSVQVGNRGLAPAQQVHVAAWVADQSLRWSALGSAQVSGPVPAGQRRSVTLDASSAPRDARWLLVRVHNDADPSLVGEAHPAWPTDEAPLMQLVSSDNNLGLCAWKA